MRREEVGVRTVTFTEFRNNTKKHFDTVEQGEVVKVYRHGKPVALLSPLKISSMGRWKTAAPLKLKGVSLSKIILEGRRIS